MSISWKHQSLLGMCVEREKVFTHPTCAGLRLRIYPNGKKVWQWKRTLNKRPLWATLGQFPAMGMALADDRAREMNDKIDLGLDPLAKPEIAPIQIKRMPLPETTCGGEGIGSCLSAMQANEVLRVISISLPLVLSNKARRICHEKCGSG